MTAIHEPKEPNEEQKSRLEKNHPLLKQDKGWKIIGDKTPVYNCLAWAWGETTERYMGMEYFPEEGQEHVALEGFQSLDKSSRWPIFPVFLLFCTLILILTP
jgi:hypothetical protein